MSELTVSDIKLEASIFLHSLSQRGIDSLFGVTDGKAVGTYVEQQFHAHLGEDYQYVIGSSARGIDFPELDVDLKVTSTRQPQSSCPYRSAEQKVYGLGYHLMIFVYDKLDDSVSELAYLNFVNAVFVADKRTADYQTTNGIIRILNNGANLDDIDAFLEERNLPLDDVGRRLLAERILADPPKQGYVTISNALQWRLQYTRTISIAGQVDGVDNLL